MYEANYGWISRIQPDRYHRPHPLQNLQGYEYDIDTLRKLVVEAGVVEDSGRNSLCKIIPLDVLRMNARRVIPFALSDEHVGPIHIVESLDGKTSAELIQGLSHDRTVERSHVQTHRMVTSLDAIA